MKFVKGKYYVAAVEIPARSAQCPGLDPPDVFLAPDAVVKYESQVTGDFHKFTDASAKPVTINIHNWGPDLIPQ